MKSYVFYYTKRLLWLIYHYLEIFHTSTCLFISSNHISFILLLIALSILCSSTEDTIKSTDNFSCKLSNLFFPDCFFSQYLFSISCSTIILPIFCLNLHLKFWLDSRTLVKFGIKRSYVHEFMNTLTNLVFSYFVLRF